MTAEPDASHTGGLGGVVKRGAGVAASGVVIVQAVSITQTLVLGRVLGPEQVGIYIAGSVLVSFVMVMAHGTLSQALIQRERDIEDAANTALVATVMTGLLLALASLAVSPFIGDLFHSERVGLIAAATSGIMLLYSLSSVPDALMQRAFQFKRRIVIDPAVSITFAGVAIVFAALGFGAWAMVIGSYASMIVWVGLSWWLAKWRPFRGRFSFRIWREMARFSLPVAIEGLAERARESLEQVIVGRVLGISSLGQYRYAFRIGSIPTIGIVNICSYVLFPAFSRISGDGARFQQAFLRALGWLWLAALPVAALMIMTGEPIVVLLMGDEWRPAGTATEAMAGMGLGLALCSVAVEATKGAGRSFPLTWLAALHLGLGLPMVLLLLPYGLVGVGVALSITHLAMGIVSVVLARSVVGVSFRDIGASLAPSTLSAVVAFGVVLPVKHLLLRSDLALLPGLASIIAIGLVFVTVYLAALRVFAPTWSSAIHHLIGQALTAVKGRRHTAAGAP